MTTGQRMKQRRKTLGLSAEYVAEALNVSPATIYRYENGDIEKVPGDRLGPIAAVLNTTPAYLMGWNDSASAVYFPCPPDTLKALTREFREAIKDLPVGRTSKRVSILLRECFHGYYDDIVVYLGLDDRELNEWMQYGVFPAPQTVDSLLGYFRLSPEELLDESDLVEYHNRKKDARYYIPFTDMGKNIIGIAKRDGSYEERELTDAQTDALLSFLKLLPSESR